jgi:hypothetical protein
MRSCLELRVGRFMRRRTPPRGRRPVLLLQLAAGEIAPARTGGTSSGPAVRCQRARAAAGSLQAMARARAALRRPAPRVTPVRRRTAGRDGGLDRVRGPKLRRVPGWEVAVGEPGARRTAPAGRCSATVESSPIVSPAPPTPSVGQAGLHLRHYRAVPYFGSWTQTVVYPRF